MVGSPAGGWLLEPVAPQFRVVQWTGEFSKRLYVHTQIKCTFCQFYSHLRAIRKTCRPLTVVQRAVGVVVVRLTVDKVVFKVVNKQELALALASGRPILKTLHFTTYFLKGAFVYMQTHIYLAHSVILRI